jgi:hypothetical protein
MKILEIRDNEGQTADLFTVVYDEREHSGLYACVSMNHEPFHPQGIGMHCSAMPGHHLGKKISFSDLPVDCRKLVIRDLGYNPIHEELEAIKLDLLNLMNTDLDELMDDTELEIQKAINHINKALETS